MPPYDSDSSDEDEEYTETNTLLGYASPGASGDTISHLGGAPVSPSIFAWGGRRLT
jgi:pre-rRNA-processing protein TSR4